MANVKKTTKKVTTKAVEIKTLAQLNEDLISSKAELLESKKSHRAGELVNPHILTVKRKEIARIKTAIAIESRKENE